MKLKPLPSGEIVIEIRTAVGVRSIRTHTKLMSEAQEIARSCNIPAIELAAKKEKVSRALVRALTTGGKRMFIEVVAEWERWRHSVCESANSTINMSAYAYAWVRFSHLKDRHPDSITEEDVDGWVNQEDGSKASTRKFRLSVARSVLNYCVDKNLCDVNVARLVRVKYRPLSDEQKRVRRKTSFTDEEYERLKTYLRNRIAVEEVHPITQRDQKQLYWLKFALSLVIIGRNTALRLGDIACLEWSSINDVSINVCTDKRNKWVNVPLNDEMREVFLSIPRRGSNFCWANIAELYTDPHRRSCISKRLGRILKEAGLEHHIFHEMRATKLTEIVNNGGSLEEAREFAGHTSTSTTKGYITNAT